MSWLAGANLIVKPFWFLFLLVSTRLLGPQEFGKYMLVISFVAVIATLAEGGIDILFVREVSANPREYGAFLSHTISAKLASLVLVAIIVLSSAVILRFSQEMLALTFYGLVYSACNSLMVHVRCVFRAFENMKLEGVSIVIERFSTILFCGAALLFSLRAQEFLAAFALSSFVAMVLAVVIAFRNFGIPEWSFDSGYLWSKVIKPALPFALMNIFIVIYFRSGTLLLSALTRNTELVGYYSAGYRLVESFMLFPLVVATPLYPVFSRLRIQSTELQDILLRSLRLVVSAAFLVAVPIVLYRESITALLFGAEFSNASLTIGIVCISMIPVSATFIAGSVVSNLGRQGKANVFIFFGMVFNIVLNYVLIQKFASEGAAITTVLTDLFIAGANLWLIRDYLRSQHILELLGKLSIPVLAAVGFHLVNPVHVGLVGSLLITTGILAGGFALAKLVTLTDLRRFAAVK